MNLQYEMEFENSSLQTSVYNCKIKDSGSNMKWIAHKMDGS